MAQVDLKPDKYINKVVSHNDEVQLKLRAEATAIRDKAQSGLAAHTKEGQHSITMTHGEVDYYVTLQGPAAAALELGHMDKGHFVEGIHILRQQDG